MDQHFSILQGSSQTNRLEINGFRVTHATFPAQLYLPSHYHEAACFAVVMQGAVDKLFPGQAHTLPPRSLVTMPPQERHCDRFAASGARMLVIEPVTVAEDVLHPCAHLFDDIHVVRDESLYALSHRIARELHNPDAVSTLTINGLIFELLAGAGRRKQSYNGIGAAPPIWLNSVHDYLHDRFKHTFRLADLAEAVGVHPVHLSRVFGLYYGMTLGEYVRRLRVEWARQQLATTAHSLAYLAQAAGFSDQSHFTRVFKAHIGVTPGQYRHTLRR